MQRRPAVIIILHLELRALVTHDNQDVLDHLLGAILGGHMQPDGGQNVPAHLLLHVGDGVIDGEGKHPLMLNCARRQDSHRDCQSWRKRPSAQSLTQNDYGLSLLLAWCLRCSILEKPYST